MEGLRLFLVAIVKTTIDAAKGNWASGPIFVNRGTWVRGIGGELDLLKKKVVNW